MKQMLPIERLLDWSQDTYDEQIEIRSKMIRECVGKFWPNVLYDEIAKINTIKAQMRSEDHK